VEAFLKSDFNLVHGFDLFVWQLSALVRSSSADRCHSQRGIVGTHPQHLSRSLFAPPVDPLQTQQPIRVQRRRKVIASLKKNRPPFSRLATAGT
jgi:hypothetical protein